MISKFMRRHFRFIKNLVDKQSMNDKTKSSVAVVGLGLLLTQISQGKKSSNIVVKSGLRLRSRTTITGRGSRLGQQHSCFLKACHLCNKGLSLDKEVYMYRYIFLQLMKSLDKIFVDYHTLSSVTKF